LVLLEIVDDHMLKAARVFFGHPGVFLQQARGQHHQSSKYNGVGGLQQFLYAGVERDTTSSR
jgi:hypothetical protein